ncbi:MAG: zinc dependent phospholipase C family protein [Spirochaetaceae bacterium]|nr:zinc dependent phospholipase C family protein [Spirochaetaceae bacterium]
MPKELAHWWLAGETLASLQAGCPLLAELLARSRNVFFLGAVGPDFLFYYLYGSETGRFGEASRILHGSDGSDTLAILAKTAEAWSAAPENGNAVPDTVWAFLYGYACHVVSDAVFHPLVYYLTGKGGSESLYSHYLFETALDLYIKDVLRPEDLPLRLNSLTSRMEMKREAFLDLLGFVSFGGASYKRGELAACLRRYERMQAALWSFFWQALSRAAGAAGALRHFVPSFYRKSYRRLAPVFTQTFSYRNPATGESHEHSIADLRDEVVRQAGGIAAAFEEALASPSSRPAAHLEKIRGPNLETGLYGDTAEKITYTLPGGLAEVLAAAGLRGVL